MSAAATPPSQPDDNALRPCTALALAALRSGRGVLAVGPAGIGKSRALHSVATTLEAAGDTVVRVTATASMAAVPFGALLPLGGGRISESPDGRWLTVTAAALRRALLERPGLVLAVDDGHLLDAPSAGVIHQVGVDGVRVLVTARTPAPLPDAVARLVEDAGAARIDIEPMTEHETAAMLEDVLGALVDERLAAVVHARTGGVPLASAALGRLAVRSGAAEVVRGRWLLVDELPRSVELGVLMSSATDALEPEARRAAELVALAEGLGAPDLAVLDALEGAEDAERSGVLATSKAGVVTVAHPLLTDALLAGMPELQRRRRLTELADAEDDGDAEQTAAVDRVRRVSRALDLGRAVAPAQLLELAGLVAAGNPALAERFARAAVESGAGIPGQLRLAELLAHQHRADEAEEVLTGLDVSALDDDAALSVDLTRAFLLVFVLARPEEALDELLRYPASPMVEALRASAHYYAGRGDVADGAAEAVATDDSAPVVARAHAALTRTSVFAMQKSHVAFESWLPVAEDLLGQVRADIPEGAESLRLLEALAPLRSTLDVRRSLDLGVVGYRRALDCGEDGERSQWAHLLGLGALLTGDAVEAVDMLRRASAGRGRWTSALAGWVRSALVQALVLTGELAEAEREFVELGGVRCQPLMRTDVVRCAALLAAAQRNLTRAGTLVEAAARTGAVGAVDAWYDAMRYGRPRAAKEFLRAAADMPGPARAAQRAHAAASAAHDPSALERASEDLEAAGLGWYAIDAMAAAVQEHARRDPGDGAPGERLRLLSARHPSLRSPLAAMAGRPALTEREAQVARLAASGPTARCIAEQLGIGVRTVETHLSNAYRKLGVQTRDELRRALGSP